MKIRCPFVLVSLIVQKKSLHFRLVLCVGRFKSKVTDMLFWGLHISMERLLELEVKSRIIRWVEAL